MKTCFRILTVMELQYTGLNEVRPAVYRAALKLRSLQKQCQMHLVTLQHLRPVLNTLNRSGDAMVRLSQEDVQQSLQQLFQNTSEELSGQAVREATDQTTRLLFKLFDREQTGVILLRSVEAALIALSGDTLTAKHRGLYNVYLHNDYIGNQDSDSGSVSRTGLRVLLDDLSQVPAAVQENHVFGHVDTAVASCFNGVINASVTEEHFLNWLQSEPRLLLWLSTLYRLSVSETVHHRVRCHTCKAFPITGLRYRCLKCLNTHLCQSCFLTERGSKKHKPSHPVLEFCTQPSWKESVTSLASSARRALIPRHHTRRDAERTQRALRAGSSAELQYIAPASVQQPVEAPDTLGGSESGVTAAPVVLSVESKSLQTEDTETVQVSYLHHLRKETAIFQKDLSVTQKAMREMQRDKWLLEKEFQVWRVAAQSEHDSLEDKCTELKTMMDALSQHNQHLEDELDRVRHVLSLRDRNDLTINLDSHVNLPQQDHDAISENEFTPPCDISSEKEELVDERNGYREQVIDLGSKEVKQGTVYEVSEDICTNLDDTDSVFMQELHTVTEEVEGLEEEEEELFHERQDLSVHQPGIYVFAQKEHSVSDDSDTEEELCELVQRLRNELSFCAPTGSVCVEKEMLMMAAEGIRDSVSHLVASVSDSLA
ncbi:dystrotelin [Triplophysa dalaica]|uniref:dystrotelin n=1 Tax=Triplophysa dalaica TaxID=1582913 RepID=UPI0024DFD3E3|nr:dystrotelin [Triplophysa dalaica]